LRKQPPRKKSPRKQPPRKKSPRQKSPRKKLRPRKPLATLPHQADKRHCIKWIEKISTQKVVDKK
jgi:hypothetical protein